MRTRPLLALAVLVAMVVSFVFLFARPEPVQAQDAGQRKRQRVLVLGFDGADSQRTEKLLAEGRLPNLAKLRDRGSYAPLMPSNPAQSPVSWASISTGMNPGGHGIYDFLARDCSEGDSPRIEIGLVGKTEEEILSAPLRGAIVFGMGGLGCVLGAGLAWLVLARFDRRWKRGGWLQAAACLPGSVFALGAMTALAWVPTSVPDAVNRRQGEPFWQTLDRAGVRCVALEAPVSFPADHMDHGACLAGLGVPDMQQTWGLFSIWSDAPKLAATTETGGTGYYVRSDRDDFDFDLVLRGPPTPFRDDPVVRDRILAAEAAAKHMKYKRQIAHDWSIPERRKSETDEALLLMADRLTCSLPVRITRGEKAEVTLLDGSVVTLLPGQWSKLLPVTFRANPVVQLHGRVQMILMEEGTKRDNAGGWRPFKLFVAPVQFDAAEVPPNVGLSSPHAFAGEVASRIGPYHTLGWPEMTSAVKDDWLDDKLFLAHTYAVMKTREKKLADQLSRDDWDCIFAVFTEQDRVQHAFWRHVDPEVPSHDPLTAPEFAPEVDKIYVQMDRIVGEALEAVGDDTHVIVISDHGFAPFRRGVNLTNFLRAKGYQVTRGGGTAGPASVGQLFTNTPWFPDVDWNRTVAYSMGLGNVYLNRVGREGGGIVTPDQAPAILERIKQDLLALKDTNGKKVVRNVYFGKDIFAGQAVESAPDLVVGFDWGYRVSWQSSLGNLDADVITDNTFRWSGDHCSVDPPLVRGIWFSSLPVDASAEPHVEDVGPSVLSLFDVKHDAADGENILAGD